MASGFLVLADGRCLARRTTAYDEVLRVLADELANNLAADPGAAPLHAWLLSLLPGPDDYHHLGYGPWLRASDQVTVERFLDLRELTPDNQRRVHDAARRVSGCLEAGKDCGCPEWIRQTIVDLGDMVARADAGERPLSRSDWIEVAPSLDRRRGPGWDDEGSE